MLTNPSGPTPTSAKNAPYRPKSSDGLSLREFEVVQFVVEVKTGAEIDKILSLLPKSAETYRSRLMLKLGIINPFSP